MLYCEICGELADKNIKWPGEDDYHYYCDKCIEEEAERRGAIREAQRVGYPNAGSDMRD